MAALKAQFSEMHSSKIQVQEEFNYLKEQYENQLNEINKQVLIILLFSLLNKDYVVYTLIVGSLCSSNAL